MGMIGFSLAEHSTEEFKGFGICNTPKDLPLDAYIQVFVNWAQQHPENWARHKVWATFAFTEKWRCP